MTEVEKEAFRVWALARMKRHAEECSVEDGRGRREGAVAVAACTELWACLDKVLGLGIADPTHRAYLDRETGGA
jgi:hypothetical protein